MFLVLPFADAIGGVFFAKAMAAAPPRVVPADREVI
jgi:hypothetical protein